MRGWFLCGLIVAVALAYSFRLTSFLYAKELVLVAGTLVLAVLACLDPERQVKAGVRLFAPLWLLSLWCLVLYLLAGRAHLPERVLVEVCRWLVLLSAVAVVADLLRTSVWRSRIEMALVVSAFAVSLLGIMQYARQLPGVFPDFGGTAQRMYSVFGNQDLSGGYAALGVVLLFSRFLRNDVSPRVASFLGPMLLGALLLSGCRSAWLAALSGLIVAGAMGERTVSGRAAAVAMVGALALVTALCAVAPEATSQRVLTTLRAKDVGGRVRLWIWDGTLRMIGDRPWLGVGPGNYAYWSPWYMGAALHVDKGRDLYYNERHAEHAHNEVLELVAETGMIGFVFALWMLARLIRAPGAHWAGMTALLVFGLFNAGFHSAPHGLAFVLLAGAGVFGGIRVRMNPEGRWVSCSMMVLAGILAAVFVGAVFVPSYLLRRAEDAHLANDNWEVAYEQVLQWPWPVWKAHEEYGIALYDAGRLEEAAARFEASLAGVDTGRPYLALGVIHCGWGRAEAAEEYLRACLWRWPRNRRAWEYLLTVTPDHAKSDLISEAATWGIDLRMQ